MCVWWGSLVAAKRPLGAPGTLLAVVEGMNTHRYSILLGGLVAATASVVCASCSAGGEEFTLVDSGTGGGDAGTVPGDEGAARPACGIDASAVHGLRSDGRVDVSASEAWPNRGPEPPPLSPSEVLGACAILSALLHAAPSRCRCRGSGQVTCGPDPSLRHSQLSRHRGEGRPRQREQRALDLRCAAASARRWLQGSLPEHQASRPPRVPGRRLLVGRSASRRDVPGGHCVARERSGDLHARLFPFVYCLQRELSHRMRRSAESRLRSGGQGSM
jgi:hypothetical protein